MSTAPPTRRKILFVDDEPQFLEMIERVMRLWSKDSWDIFVAQNAGTALSIIQDQPVNLVVIDVCMPVVDGLQFLTLLNRKYPDLQKVVLTGYATDSYRAACLSNGAELFLEKPRTNERLESLFAALNELTKWQPEPGFRGVLRRVGLQDVIQMECLSGNSSVLEVTTQGTRGLIFIHDGSIIHAEVGTRKGEEAFHHLLGLPGGEFRLNHFQEPSERTISGQWEFFLMESARVRDEAAEAVTVGVEKPKTDAVPADAAAPPPAPAGVPETVASTTPGRIEELVVCSPQGDVLYQWQSRNPDLRIDFLEFLSQKSRSMNQLLPLGAFDRLEIRGDGSRMVAQVRPDRGVILRSTPATTGSAAAPTVRPLEAPPLKLRLSE